MNDFMLPVPSDGLFLERERIHRLIARSITGGLLLLSAGEGYGKTIEVSSFLRKNPEMFLWHQVRGNGDQTLRFWDNYTRTVGSYKPAAGKALREIDFPRTMQQFDQWCEIARREFTFPEKFVIVIDDFYRVKLRTTLDFVNTALLHPIPNHLMILLCRSEPKIDLFPLISKGNLARIGAEELLFTEEETTAFFRLRGLELTAEEVSAVHRDTEGWPLLTGIAAAYMQSHPRRNDGKHNVFFLDKTIFRLYADDHFVSVNAELQRYLIKLSVCETWPLDFLRRTAGLLPSPEMELEKIGALVCYDYYLPGYRPHHLFREYLREKQHEIPFNEIKEISIIAAQWCLENNLTIEAAMLFERIADYTGISAIVDSFSHRMPSTAAAPLLEIVERLIQTNPGPDNESFNYMACLIRGRLLWYLARFKEAAVVFQENIAFISGRPLTPANTRIASESWNYLGNMAFIRQCSGIDNHDACFENAEHYYRLNPYPPPAAVTINYIGSYVNHVAPPAQAGEMERWLNTFIARLPRAAGALNGHLCGLDDLGRAELAFFQGNLDAVEQYARAAIIKSRGNHQCEIEMRGLFFLLRLTLCRQTTEGSADELIALWKQKDALMENVGCHFRNAMSDIFDGWLHIRMGEPMKAAGWLRGGNEKSDLSSLFHNYECLVKAMYCYAEKDYPRAIAILDLPENRESLGSYALGLIEMNCLKAAACYRKGNEAEALAVLEQVYYAAFPNSIIIPFIELGYDMRSLASAALNGNTGIPRLWLEQIRSLASAYGKNVTGIAGQFRDKTKASAAVYLTRQELAVLKGLSLGRTREEIAAETGQPLGTIKNLISIVCAKLDAVNRADAVRIASGLGLLGN